MTALQTKPSTNISNFGLDGAYPINWDLFEIDADFLRADGPLPMEPIDSRIFGTNLLKFNGQLGNPTFAPFFRPPAYSAKAFQSGRIEECIAVMKAVITTMENNPATPTSRVESMLELESVLGVIHTELLFIGACRVSVTKS